VVLQYRRGIGLPAAGRDLSRPPAARQGGFFNIQGFEIDILERKLDEVKSVAVGVSRGLRDLQRSTPHGKEKPGRRPGDLLVAAACCELLRKTAVTPTGPRYVEDTADVAQRLYASDRDVADFVQRAAVDPARTDTAGWAAELLVISVADFLTATEAPGAFAQLLGRCLTVAVGGTVKVPSRSHPLQLCGAWLGEGGAKPVYALSLTSINLAPSKLVALSVWSEDVGSMSTPSIEAVVRDALQHDLGALLDTTLLDTNAATSLRPAGLFNGATAVTASTATPLTDAMLADLGALAAAVSTGAPDARPLFIMNGKQGLRLGIQAPGFGDAIVSNYMPAGSVGAIDANAVVMMLSGIQFLSSISATVHMSDPALPIATGPQGTAVIAAPTTSLFQQDMIGLRSVLRASWAKRRSGATALATGVTW
jgi:hypothetical protein